MDEQVKNNQIEKSGSLTKRTFVFWLVSTVVLLGIDQLSKWLVFRYNVFLSFENLFGITTFQNDHFAFSLPVPIVITYAIYAIVFLCIGYYLKKYHARLSRHEQLGWMLIIVGGISNVVERLLIGYVRDIIQVPFGGIINIADIYIILGIIFLLFKELGLSRRK